VTDPLAHAGPGAERFYRSRMKPEGLVRFEVREGETGT
jgi:hypothetical protein